LDSLSNMILHVHSYVANYIWPQVRKHNQETDNEDWIIEIDKNKI
jgi:hypothetical protein